MMKIYYVFLFVNLLKNERFFGLWIEGYGSGTLLASFLKSCTLNRTKALITMICKSCIKSCTYTIMSIFIKKKQSFASLVLCSWLDQSS